MTLQLQRSFDLEAGLWNITPEGEVDISTASMLRNVLDEAYRENKADIILHFDHLNYMDSTGLGVIIGAYGRMKESGNDIILKNPKENIKKLLRITNLDRLLCPELFE
ncbi:MAG TPA: STAS domain-containing protein [Bacillota bacterium]|jgi:anti-sigma B factor antagonist|nr:STAS domain-containing protein [Bacillota bacterium]